MEFSIQVTPDLESVIAGMQGTAILQGLRSSMGRFAAEALEIARRFAPHDTGTFAEGLNYQPFGEMGFQITTNDPELASMLRTGTGIYGPSGQRIVPTSARALIIGRWKGSDVPPNFRAVWAFASVAGMQANPWEDLAREEITARGTIVLQDTLGDLLQLGE